MDDNETEKLQSDLTQVVIELNAATETEDRRNVLRKIRRLAGEIERLLAEPQSDYR